MATNTRQINHNHYVMSNASIQANGHLDNRCDKITLVLSKPVY